jgi:hypothetical protein
VTEAQLDEIDAGVGFALPPEYRRVAASPPFRSIGRDCVYWFFDDPAWVIGETRAPLAVGGYEGDGWRAGCLTIGSSAAGDLYVMDTHAPGLPVLCLSHETHEFEPEWPTFEAFVQEWLRVPDEIERQAVEEAAAARAARRARNRRGLLITAAILVACAVILIIQGLLLIR